MEKNKTKQESKGTAEEVKTPSAASKIIEASSEGVETQTAAESAGVDEKTDLRDAVVKPKDLPKNQEVNISNRLREFRIENMMSKAELARKAGLSVLTVARIEKGYGCRMDTKRKILKALGLKLADRRKVFEDD